MQTPQLSAKIFSNAVRAMLLGFAAQALHVQATTVTFGDFSDVSTLQLNGNAATAATGDGTVLRLTPATTGQSGSAWLKDTIQLQNQASFSTFFSFRISSSGGIIDSDGTGADGIVFGVQTSANSAGGSGGGIGFQGIPNSVGIEFDTWDNGAQDGSDGNHVGVDINGNMNSVARVHVPTRMNDGNIWYAWIDYDGVNHQLETRLSTSSSRPAAPLLSYNVDLTTVLMTSDAYAGFTSGTGSAYGNHDILSWQFVNDFQPIVSAPETPATLPLLGLGVAAIFALSRRFQKA